MNKPSTVLIIEPRKGRKLKDRATGIIYEFNGKKWIKQHVKNHTFSAASES